MFCPKCGKENPDGARFCAACGKAFEVAEPVAPAEVTATAETPAAPTTSASTTPSTIENFIDKVKALWAKKEVKIGVAIAAVAIIAIILLSGGGGASSPEGAAENFMDAMIDCDIEEMIECMPPQISDKMLDMLDMSGMGTEMIEQKMRQELPANVSYNVLGKEVIDEERIGVYESELSEVARQLGETDYKVEIEEAFYMEVICYYDGDSDSENLTVGKIDGKWYVLEPDIINDIM